MNKNINTFNLWAEDNRDEKMQKNHTDSVNKMIDIIKNETNKLNKPFKFLDLGCGNGWVVRKISQHNNCKYSIGIDGSRNMIKKAKSYSIGDFEETTIESYHYKSKFDIIFTMETLYYLDDINQLFYTLYDTGLKNHGIFIMGIDHYKENIPSLNWGKDYNLKINTLSIDEWHDLFLSHGFRDIKIYQHGKNNDWQGTLILIGTKIEKKNEELEYACNTM
jgi:SAM-dependent methyltransferase